MGLNIGAWRFTPGIAPTLGAALMIALTVALGQWQLRRAAFKTELRDRIEAHAREVPVRLSTTAVEAADYQWRRVEVRGTYDAERTILLDNRILDGRVGYQVVTPLRIEGGTRYVLVNRGWVALGPTRSELPAVPVPQGMQTISGIAVVPPAKVFELGDASPESRRWQNLVLDRFAHWSGLDLQPIVIEQTNDAGDGLERRWDRPDLGVEKHQAYAVQWYSLAVLTFVLYVFLNLKRESAGATQPRRN